MPTQVTPQVPEFSWTPDWGSERKTDHQVAMSQLGDGYTQVLTTSIAPTTKTLDLKFVNRTRDVVLAIEAFLDARRGAKSFTYNHDESGIKKYISVGPYAVTPVGPNKYSISVTLREVR